MGEREKSAWAKPELIVLTRGQPEENVLFGCKTLSDATGVSTTNVGCLQWCDTCPQIVNS